MADGAAAALDVNSTRLCFVSTFDAATRQIATDVTQHARTTFVLASVFEMTVNHFDLNQAE